MGHYHHPSIYLKAVGDEIRRLRTARGWTRNDLADRMQTNIKSQTLATYEHSTRQLSVIRLVEICLALDELPHELLRRVHDRIVAGTSFGLIRLNLYNILRDEQPELMPLRRWASKRLAEIPATHDTEVRLDALALQHIAALCGMDSIDLITRLGRICEPSRPPVIAPSRSRPSGRTGP